MLHSLEIRNYRNLKHLRIEKLGRVNLVVGKNNTGKTSLLEAVMLYLAFDTVDFFGWIGNKLLANREGEITSPLEYEENVDRFSNMFTNKKYDLYNETYAIAVGEISDNQKLKIRLIRTLVFPDGSFKIVEHPDEAKGKFFEIELMGRKNEQNYQSLGVLNGQFQRRISKEFIQINMQFISSSLIISPNNAALWGEIELSSKRDFIFQALKIIVNSTVENLSYAGKNAANPQIKIEKQPPVLLRSMGDGINRILTIILSMVNCENGYLLIDEFENGLHYSVQEKLWEIIFQLSKKLNIQVFATTHSNDTIRSFGTIANRSDEIFESPSLNGSESIPKARLIRLVNVNGEIRAVSLDEENLAVINGSDLDPR